MHIQNNVTSKVQTA